MAATRLGKEASDLYAVKKQPVILSRGDLTAKATVQRVVVYNNDRCLCRVENEEGGLYFNRSNLRINYFFISDYQYKFSYY